jgi:hypothetical protein
MSIFKNLQKAHAAVAKDTFNSGDLGIRIGQLAVQAVIKGMDSQQWKDYMSLFADNEAQLNRLTVATLDEPSYLPQTRAYIVSNSICDAATGVKTHNNVDLRIDNELPVEPDGKIVRPFDIPNP